MIFQFLLSGNTILIYRKLRNNEVNWMEQLHPAVEFVGIWENSKGWLVKYSCKSGGTHRLAGNEKAYCKACQVIAEHLQTKEEALKIAKEAADKRNLKVKELTWMFINPF